MKDNSEARIALIFAKALYELAKESSQDLQELQDFFADVANLVANSRELVLLIRDPSVEPTTKFEILKTIFPKLQQDTLLAKFLASICKQRVSYVIPHLYEQFQNVCDMEIDTLKVSLTFAKEKPLESLNDFKSRLAALTNRPIRLNLNINPLLISGMIMQIGDDLFDNSLNGKLKLLESKLRA